VTRAQPLPLLDVRGVSVTFPAARARLRRRPGVPALRDVSVQVGVGETVGLVGESGSGKSTLVRVVLGLQRADAGQVHVGGVALPVRDLGRYPRTLRKDVQVLFQDPYAALNPSMTVDALVGEGLALHLGLRGAARSARTASLLDAVGLAAGLAQRFPRELSGGQLQRVALARALAPEPRLLVLDEPVSSVDVATAGQVVELLARLQRERGLGYLFVAHDLGLVERASHRAVVLYRGRVMESGPAGALWAEPRHPYTQALLAAVPVADPAVQARRRAQRRALTGGLVPPLPPDGLCPFRHRCPRRGDACDQAFPPPVPASDGTVAHCHHPGPPEGNRPPRGDA
jgi:oligopeptide/dipeptide ABC transporter ATP-binding protein